MNTIRATLAMAATTGLAATLLTAAPADAAAPRITAKTVCQDNGNTRVQIKAKVRGKTDELVSYSWKVTGRDSREGSVLMEAPYDGMLIAFTIPAGKTAKVAIGRDLDWDGGLFSQRFRARDC